MQYHLETKREISFHYIQPSDEFSNITSKRNYFLMSLDLILKKNISFNLYNALNIKNQIYMLVVTWRVEFEFLESM